MSGQITLNKDSGGQLTLAPEDNAVNKTITIPDVGVGKILQVVDGSTSSEVSVTTTSYTDTGLSASITPSSTSSKILVLVDQQCSVDRQSHYAYLGLRLLRDSTVIHDPLKDSSGSFEFGLHIEGATRVIMYNRLHITMLDSPATTSSITYKTMGRPYTTSNTGRAFFQRDSSTDGTSRIILMEVAG